jgi:hypothetical protein
MSLLLSPLHPRPNLLPHLGRPTQQPSGRLPPPLSLSHRQADPTGQISFRPFPPFLPPHSAAQETRTGFKSPPPCPHPSEPSPTSGITVPISCPRFPFPFLPFSLWQVVPSRTGHGRDPRPSITPFPALPRPYKTPAAHLSPFPLALHPSINHTPTRSRCLLLAGALPLRARVSCPAIMTYHAATLSHFPVSSFIVAGLPRHQDAQDRHTATVTPSPMSARGPLPIVRHPHTASARVFPPGELNVSSPLFSSTSRRPSCTAAPPPCLAGEVPCGPLFLAAQSDPRAGCALDTIGSHTDVTDQRSTASLRPCHGHVSRPSQSPFATCRHVSNSHPVSTSFAIKPLRTLKSVHCSISLVKLTTNPLTY